MSKTIVLSWDAVVAIGQIILHEGEPSLVVKSMPEEECIVLFIKKSEWPSIKRQAERKE